MAFEISIGPNLRKSVYFDATVADGVQSFSVYNHMLIPAHFGNPEAEYDRLMNGVAQWDVAAQRQVELVGPDAHRLVQYLTARDMSTARVGRARYVPICNHAGILINDPVALMLSPERFWLSIADSDVELWAAAIAAERGFDVAVFEPDVSPLAVQGPMAESVVVDLFGRWPTELPYFGFAETDLHGIPLILSRSGWSKQGGFELYLQDGSRGTELWEMVKRAGQAYGIGPGAPNDLERLESGLVSYGADGRMQTNPSNPFELGLGWLIDLDQPDDFVGRSALLEIRDRGPARRRIAITVAGEPIRRWEHADALRSPDGDIVGTVSEVAYSPRSAGNVGVALVAASYDADTTGLRVTVDGVERSVGISAPTDR